MTNRRVHALYFIFIGLNILLASCGDQDISSIQTKETDSSILPEATQTLLVDNEQSITSSLTPTIVVTHFPDVLINAGPYWDECDQEKPAQIWYIPYPYIEGRILLGDPTISYLSPTWSPDGEWIAYIHSDPAYIEWMQGIPESVGTESIWIMRPDGSDARQISADFPAWNYIDHTGFCVGYGSFINHWSGLAWSKNGNLISFRYISGNNPAKQENTQVITVAEYSPMPEIEIPGIGAIWSPHGNQLINMEGNLVSLYEFTEQGVSLSLQSQYPNSSVDHKLVWPATRKYPLLIFTKQLPDVAYGNTYEIWEWNISSGNWTKLLDRVGEGEYITNEPYLGERWGGFLTENDKLVIIDMSTWLLTENSLPDEPIGVWGIIGWISDDQGNELLLIDSPSTVLYIQPGTAGITHGYLFEKSFLELPAGYYFNDYAWRP